MTNRMIWTGLLPLEMMGQLKGLKRDVAFKLAQALSKVRAAHKVLDDARQMLFTTYANLDEAGKPIAGADGQVQFHDATGFAKEFDALLDAEAEGMDLPSFPLTALPEEGTSPYMLLALQELGLLVDAA